MLDQLKQETDKIKIQKIEILVKALGTMVLKPQFAPTVNIGDPKMQLQPIQEGILVGTKRDLVEDKLVDLIKSL